MSNNYTVAEVGKAPTLKTKEAEKTEKTLTDLVTEITTVAYFKGYKDALVALNKSLPTNRKTINLVQLRLILSLSIKACEKEEKEVQKND